MSYSMTASASPQWFQWTLLAGSWVGVSRFRQHTEWLPLKWTFLYRPGFHFDCPKHRPCSLHKLPLRKSICSSRISAHFHWSRTFSPEMLCSMWNHSAVKRLKTARIFHGYPQKQPLLVCLNYTAGYRVPIAQDLNFALVSGKTQNILK
jgi:hypothetical protein